jgi:hypothetical protein
VLAGFVVPLVLAGCVMVPGPGGRGVALVPRLPPVVVLGEEPYYAQDGYHYHYRNDGWAYSRSRNGPWSDLPRDRYPKEVRFRNGRRR